MGRGSRTLLACLLFAAGAAVAEPRIVSLAPVRQDDWLACRVRTVELPGEKVLSSMESGLVSAVVVQVDVIDARNRRVAGRRITLQLSFDLWDEVYTLDDGAGLHRLAGLDTLLARLTTPPPLRIAPLADLRDALPPLALRAALELHPVAGPDRERIEDVIAGAGPGAVDRHEATLSFGRLIRYFSREDAQDPEGSVRSPAFQLGGLDHAQH
ncbi:MAG TPA: hypothetical protein P5571_12915 [Candidatus Krumholzibacteria bacterium]|nr:hypothetical protein [Candidatus Krumholzibacteria bacterium]HRX52263.1 hypothetical protein [Candidatus Krumholzibacteria bacterium]